jgi:hypothetical protein
MLFGHQNDTATEPVGTPPPPPAPATDGSAAVNTVNPLAVDPATGVGLPVTQDDMAAPSLDTPVAAGSLEEVALTAPEVTDEAPIVFDTPAPLDDTPVAPVASLDNTNLLSLKQQALAQLSPLVSQLDQSPEEKFRTTMMLLQSTDNSALIQDAYDAAQAIPDEKVRAQALLDVVNEINYFTQQSK